MVKPRLSFLPQIFAALVICSCVPPKAVVVQEAPKTKAPEPVAATTEPAPPPPTDDGILLPPDILSMPSDDEFKAALPTATLTNQVPGSINVRPPTEPPPRPKPKTGE